MFKHAVNILEIAGFKIRIDPSWLLIAALIVWSLSAAYFPHELPGYSPYYYVALAVIAMLGLFASLILHELSHSLVARRFGLRVGGITLFVFGGVAELEQEPESPKSELWIALAGPAMSLLLAGLFLIASIMLNGSGISKPLEIVFTYLALINFILAVFNLVPAFPLDGGRVLRALLWQYKNDLLWATRIASGFGTVFGIFLIVTGVLSMFSSSSTTGLWQVLIGFFVVNASRSSYRQLMIKTALQDHTVRNLMSSTPQVANASDTVQKTVDELMLRYHKSFIPVMIGNRLVGYVDTTAVNGVARENWPTTRLSEILVPSNPDNTVPTDMPMEELFEKMARSGQRKMLVGQDGKLEGVISLSDLMSYLAIRQGLGSPGPRRG